MEQEISNGRHADLEKFLDDLKTVVRDGQQLLKVGATSLKDKARVRAQSADRAIRGNPYQTLGIVLGVGFLLGLFLSKSWGSESGEEEY
jgi:ElaB/YqjD/DUF883 family membrane-anchored ribosome-binding protein